MFYVCCLLLSLRGLFMQMYLFISLPFLSLVLCLLLLLLLLSLLLLLLLYMYVYIYVYIYIYIFVCLFLLSLFLLLTLLGVVLLVGLLLHAAEATLSPPSAPCPSAAAHPFPWQSLEAFVLQLRRWRSDGHDTLCSSSSLQEGDTETVAAKKAPWLHNVTPTIYDSSFIKVR